MARRNRIITSMEDSLIEEIKAWQADADADTRAEARVREVEARALALMPSRAVTPAASPAPAPMGPAGPGAKPGLPALQERVLAPGEAAPSPQTGIAAPLPPMAAPARLRARHRGQALSFLVCVMLPVLLVTFYLTQIARDQYASTTGFSVQREEGGGASDLLGGLVAFGGASAGARDTDILFEFIQSQEIVERIDGRQDLLSHYAQHWEGEIWETDKVFSIWPDATIEDLTWFWERVVRIAYDQSTGLIEVQVRAFDPLFARTIAAEIVAESQAMINDLSAAARADAMGYAEADLDEALERLKSAREALTAFRSRTQIVDPLADLQGRMGVMSSLQQQLAEALIAYDLLLETTRAGDPRLDQASRRIEALRGRIAAERESFAADGAISGDPGEAYPQLIAEFERLMVDREYAEEAYRAALMALDLARANAARQSRYLATYIEPTLAQSADYPQRWLIIALTAFFALLAWSTVLLIYYSVRDRR